MFLLHLKKQILYFVLKVEVVMTDENDPQESPTLLSMRNAKIIITIIIIIMVLWRYYMICS